MALDQETHLLYRVTHEVVSSVQSYTGTYWYSWAGPQVP